jgi:uncharacterized protein (TIGR02118 family)
MIKLIALLKREAGMTQEAFKQRWLDEHTKLSGIMPGLLEYRINIATPHQPDDAAGPVYDGTAELWWDSMEAMEAAFASPEGVAAGKDADSFADVRLHIYTDEYIVVPGPVRPAPAKRATKRPVAKKRATRRAEKKAKSRARK